MICGKKNRGPSIPRDFIEIVVRNIDLKVHKSSSENLANNNPKNVMYHWFSDFDNMEQLEGQVGPDLRRNSH